MDVRRADGGAARRRPSMDTAVMLIDFDNLGGLRDVADSPALASRLMEVVRKFLLVLPDAVDQLVIRLYGGWYEGYALTSKASIVAQLVAASDPFPFRYGERLIAGEIALAQGLFSTPGQVLPGTYRKRRSVERLRRNKALQAVTCTGDDSCGARRLSKWTEGPLKMCPTAGCTVTCQDAFIATEQKMVDTLMAVDLIELANRNVYAAVAIASDDTDFVPALMYSARSQTAVVYVTSLNHNESLEVLLQAAGVQRIGMEL